MYKNYVAFATPLLLSSQQCTQRHTQLQQWMCVTSWSCRQREHRWCISLISQWGIGSRNVAQTLQGCFVAFCVYFFVVVNCLFVFHWDFCFLLCPPESTVESFWTSNMGHSVFSLQWLKTARKFSRELFKAKPQCLCLVGAVLLILQHSRKKCGVNHSRDQLGWAGWLQKQGLCHTAQSCTGVCLHPCSALRYEAEMHKELFVFPMLTQRRLCFLKSLKALDLVQSHLAASESLPMLFCL